MQTSTQTPVTYTYEDEANGTQSPYFADNQIAQDNKVFFQMNNQTFRSIYETGKIAHDSSESTNQMPGTDLERPSTKMPIPLPKPVVKSPENCFSPQIKSDKSLYTFQEKWGSFKPDNQKARARFRNGAPAGDIPYGVMKFYNQQQYMIYRQQDDDQGLGGQPVIQNNMQNLQIQQRQIENQLHQYYQTKMLGNQNINPVPHLLNSQYAIMSEREQKSFAGRIHNADHIQNVNQTFLPHTTKHRQHNTQEQLHVAGHNISFGKNEHSDTNNNSLLNSTVITERTAPRPMSSRNSTSVNQVISQKTGSTIGVGNQQVFRLISKRAGSIQTQKGEISKSSERVAESTAKDKMGLPVSININNMDGQPKYTTTNLGDTFRGEGSLMQPGSTRRAVSVSQVYRNQAEQAYYIPHMNDIVSNNQQKEIFMSLRPQSRDDYSKKAQNPQFYIETMNDNSKVIKQINKTFLSDNHQRFLRRLGDHHTKNQKLVMYSRDARDINTKLQQNIEIEGKVAHFTNVHNVKTMTGPKYRRSPITQVLKDLNKKLVSQNYEINQKSYNCQSTRVKLYPTSNLDEHISNVTNKLEYLERYAQYAGINAENQVIEETDETRSPASVKEKADDYLLEAMMNRDIDSKMTKQSRYNSSEMSKRKASVQENQNSSVEAQSQGFKKVDRYRGRRNTVDPVAKHASKAFAPAEHQNLGNEKSTSHHQRDESTGDHSLVDGTADISKKPPVRLGPQRGGTVQGIPQYQTLQVSGLKDMPFVVQKKVNRIISRAHNNSPFQTLSEGLQNIKKPTKWAGFNNPGVSLIKVGQTHSALMPAKMNSQATDPKESGEPSNDMATIFLLPHQYGNNKETGHDSILDPMEQDMAVKIEAHEKAQKEADRVEPSKIFEAKINGKKISEPKLVSIGSPTKTKIEKLGTLYSKEDVTAVHVQTQSKQKDGSDDQDDLFVDDDQISKVVKYKKLYSIDVEMTGQSIEDDEQISDRSMHLSRITPNSEVHREQLQVTDYAAAQAAQKPQHEMSTQVNNIRLSDSHRQMATFGQPPLAPKRPNTRGHWQKGQRLADELQLNPRTLKLNVVEPSLDSTEHTFDNSRRLSQRHKSDAQSNPFSAVFPGHELGTVKGIESLMRPTYNSNKRQQVMENTTMIGQQRPQTQQDAPCKRMNNGINYVIYKAQQRRKSTQVSLYNRTRKNASRGSPERHAILSMQKGQTAETSGTQNSRVLSADLQVVVKPPHVQIVGDLYDVTGFTTKGGLDDAILDAVNQSMIQNKEESKQLTTIEKTEKLGQTNQWLHIKSRHDPNLYNQHVQNLNFKNIQTMKSRIVPKVEIANDIVKRILTPKVDGANAQVVSFPLPSGRSKRGPKEACFEYKQAFPKIQVHGRQVTPTNPVIQIKIVDLLNQAQDEVGTVKIQTRDAIIQSTQLSHESCTSNNSKSMDNGSNLDTNRYHQTTKEATYNLMFPSSQNVADTNRQVETSKEALYNMIFPVTPEQQITVTNSNNGSAFENQTAPQSKRQADNEAERDSNGSKVKIKNGVIPSNVNPFKTPQSNESHVQQRTNNDEKILHLDSLCENTDRDESSLAQQLNNHLKDAVEANEGTPNVETLLASPITSQRLDQGEPAQIEEEEAGDMQTANIIISSSNAVVE